MSVGRVVAAVATCAAVGGCAVVAVTMARAEPAPHRAADHRALPTYSVSRSIAAYRVITRRPSASPSAVPTSSAPVSSTAANTPTTSTVPRTSGARTSGSASPPSHRVSSASSAVRSSTPASHPAPHPSSTGRTTHHKPKPRPQPHGSSLPLSYTTGDATKVITVVAHSHSSTTATLQAWSKASGGGWNRVGPAIHAHVGSDGLTSSPSEFRSATPTGSHTLTQAFGRYSDPGTSLHYFKTDSADWWISEQGRYYNTHQHCSSHCGFTQGSPNEHLYYETPYYNYAVVINTPSGASAWPHGSAFFLHVTDGNPTAGCVAIPQSNLVTIMRWLTASSHPRILIGVT